MPIGRRLPCLQLQTAANVYCGICVDVRTDALISRIAFVHVTGKVREGARLSAAAMNDDSTAGQNSGTGGRNLWLVGWRAAARSVLVVRSPLTLLSSQGRTRGYFRSSGLRRNNIPR